MWMKVTEKKRKKEIWRDIKPRDRKWKQKKEREIELMSS